MGLATVSFGRRWRFGGSHDIGGGAPWTGLARGPPDRPTGHATQFCCLIVTHTTKGASEGCNPPKPVDEMLEAPIIWPIRPTFASIPPWNCLQPRVFAGKGDESVSVFRSDCYLHRLLNRLEFKSSSRLIQSFVFLVTAPGRALAEPIPLAERCNTPIGTVGMSQ